MTDLDEPLSESAILAREIAPRLCRKHPDNEQDCSWYHGLWQDLRLMGLAATPQQHSGFFPQAFGLLCEGRDRLRILISGAADYSILAHVLRACREHRMAAELTVVDICDTPLWLNDWYAKRTGVHIRTVRTDILDFTTNVPFDVICSHAFLGQFAPSRRSQIVSHWQNLLGHGGATVTINRIRPETLRDPVVFSEQQIQDFLKTVTARSGNTGTDASLLVARARLYAQRLHAYAISGSDLAALFTDHGFRIAHHLVLSLAGSADSNARGLAIPAEAQHACLVAINL
jgi:hypothetical protein